MGEERVLTQEEKFKAIAQALQYPEGRAKIGQTMCSNVALGSNTKMKSSLYAGKSENSPLLSSKESENVRDADNQQGRIDTVKCLLCNFEGKSLEGHLYDKHKISCRKYRELFGSNVKIRAKGVIEKQKATVRKKYGVDYAFHQDWVFEKRNIAIMKSFQEKYGVNSPMQIPEVKEKAKQTCWKKYGVDNPMKNREIQKKAWSKYSLIIERKYGVKNVTHIPEVVKKSFASAGRWKMNSLEKKVYNLFSNELEYTGDGRFGIKISNKRFRYPDFVVKPFNEKKKVIEVFGEFWHSKEDEEKIIQDYRSVGIECLVIWGKELSNIKEVRNKIYRYLFPSETICEQSSIKKDCEIVRTTQRCVEIGRNSYPPEEVLVSTCLH